MNVGTREPITQSLERWHIAIRTNHIQQSESIHNEIKSDITQIKEPATQLYYQLLNSRYLILKKELTSAHAILDTLNDVHLNRTDIFGYYMNLITGMLLTAEGNYEVAELRFIRAFNLLNVLNSITDDIVRADFYHKAAVLYYHIRQPLTALDYANEALKTLAEAENYELLQSGCENILGLASLSLKQYGKAEEHFLCALDLAKRIDQSYTSLIKYNIGYLYAEQNMSELAVRYLLEVFEEEEAFYKTHFLLSREFYRLNNEEKAMPFYKKGIELANEEYLHHFKILNALNQATDINELERIVKEGNDYFKQHELFGFVEDYAGELAQVFFTKENHNKASYYFKESYEAKRALQKKEALK